MPAEWTYRLMPNLPPPPQWLIDQIDLSVIPEINNIGSMGRRKLVNWNGVTGEATRNIRRAFINEYDEWIKKNITTEYMNSSLMYCPGDPDRPSTGAHTDFTRDFILMYNVFTGGPDAKLCFWKEKDQPVIRDRAVEIGEFNKLELIDSVTGPENMWYLANGRILHSTENLTSLRLNFQISFDTIVPDHLLKNV
jgi:hypothetical protein